ncbi:MAG: response regulator [Acidobacteriota bacterium]
MPNPTILIADDEVLLCEIYAELLQPHYEVVLALNGKEAREKAFSLPRLQGMLTDVRMPGLDGIQLSQEVLAQRPDVWIILMSGTDITAQVRSLFPPERVAFLAKPFELRALEETVHWMSRRWSDTG